MRELSLQRVAYFMGMMLLVIAVASCSGITDRIRSIGTSQAETPKSTPRPTPKPQPTPTKETQIANLIQQGKTERDAGDYAGAVASFEGALAIDSTHIEARNLLQETRQERDALIDEHMKQGLKYSAEENLQAAMREWEKVLELDPTHAKALEYRERTQRQLDALQ